MRVAFVCLGGDPGRWQAHHGRPRSASLVCRRFGIAIAPGVCRDLLGVFEMLKMVSKKSMLLLGAVMALCAFVLPSVASAASWAGAGNIDSTNLGFSTGALGGGSACTASSFSVTVHNATAATITGAAFRNCHGKQGTSIGCTTTATATGLPWRVTAVTTTAITIDQVDIDVSFETTPGTLNECPGQGTQLRLQGNVTGSFTPAALVGSRRFDFDGATGLTGILAPTTHIGTVAVQGQATPTGTLNVLD